jgi:hypothetical protein
MLVSAVLVMGLGAIAVFAFWRPWLGLLALLALIPFNGLLTDVIGPTLQLSSTNQTMLAAWHDALAAGVMAAAANRWIRTRPLRISSVEAATTAVLISGAISLAVAPHLVTGLYAYRTLYEPICLAVAIAALARIDGLPVRLPSRAALAIVSGGVVASLYAVWQVYVGGYSYLITFMTDSEGKLPSAYLASLVIQPRAFGTLHSPNEFGAFLAIAIVLAVSPLIARLPAAVRAWAVAALAYALLLSISRSGWVSTAAALVVLTVLLPISRAHIRRFVAAARSAGTWKTFGPPLVAFAILVGLMLSNSGFTKHVNATVTGREPSTVGRTSDIADVVHDALAITEGESSDLARLRIGLFGLGLGEAGPKASRFGEVTVDSALASEVWYVNYGLQAGIVGLLALFGLLAVIARQLWRRRWAPIAKVAIAVCGGLALGALFIPVIDEPSVAIPLWAIVGIGLSVATQAPERASVTPPA